MNTLQLQFLISIFAGWVNRGQQDIIEYLQEENRVPRGLFAIATRGAQRRDQRDPVVCQKSADPKLQQFPNTGGSHDRHSQPCVRHPG